MVFMASQTVQPQKERGAAPIGKGKPVQVRLQDRQLMVLDQWIAPKPRPTRPQAIRTLIDLEIAASKRKNNDSRLSPDRLSRAHGVGDAIYCLARVHMIAVRSEAIGQFVKFGLGASARRKSK